MIAGEWTPQYLADEHAPLVIARVLRRTKFLVILRDPVERYVSVINRWSDVTPIELAKAELRGLYFDRVQRFVDLVGADRLLVLQLERCAAEPRRQLRRTWEFLGLETRRIPVRIRRARNVAGRTIALESTTRDRLRDLYSEDMRKLAREFSAIDLDLWPSARA